MDEATNDNARHVLTYILITLLPLIFIWFGSLLKTTATQLYDCRKWHQLLNQFCRPLRHFP
jgi:hypothetical protein